MKKTTLLFVLFSIIFFQVNAQLSEDFEGSFPGDWTTLEVNGSTIYWESTMDAFSGSKAAFIDYDGDEDTEDWLISPKFMVNASNNILSFYQKRDGYDSDDIVMLSYTIRVKNITDNEDFVTIDTQTEINFNDEYVLHTVPLNTDIDYNGKEIKIAFVLSQTDGDAWYIDNVSTVNPTGVAPGCAVIKTPFINETNVTNLAGEVFLSWDAPVSGDVPSSYEVWTGLTTEPLNLVAEVGNTNYRMTGVLYDTTYNWKIVPKNYTVDAQLCETWNFKTQIENTSTPINDSCTTAISISEAPYENTQDATYANNNYPIDNGFVEACGSGMNDGVWYTFTTTAAGTVNIDITNVSSAFNVEVAVYSGTCSNLICTDYKDTAATGAGASESLSVAVDGGNQYWVNVGSNSDINNETEGAFKITLSLEAGATLGVKELETKLNVNLYPNPTNGILNMNYKGVIDVVHVFNLLGQKVESIIPNRITPQIDMSNLPSGMYVVEIRSQDKKGSYRVIKQE